MDSDGVITLRVSTQVIEHVRQLADILKLPHSRVRVIASYMGGGFGGKEDMTVEPYLARWCGRRGGRCGWCGSARSRCWRGRSAIRSGCATGPAR